MNSVQTVTVNSALSQNWVGCTVRTPKAHVASTLRAQCPGRGRCCAHNAHVARMSRAQPAQAARSACAGRAHSSHVVGACRDLPALPSQTAQVATSLRCRDIKAARIMSRHHIGVATPSLLPSLKPGRHPMSRHQFHVATSWTTNLCRDVNHMSRHPED